MTFASRLASLKSPRRLAIPGAIILSVAVAGWGAHRLLVRSEMRALLNRSAPIINPAMELQFSARRPDSPATLELFQAGQAAGLWTIHSPDRNGSAVILLTTDGRRHFSTVGNTIVAGFRAGTRLVRSVSRIRDSDTTREVSFRYEWTSLHPAVSVLGQRAPVAGETYEGEAILVRGADGWQIAHWTTPDFEAAVRQFE